MTSSKIPFDLFLGEKQGEMRQLFRIYLTREVSGGHRPIGTFKYCVSFGRLVESYDIICRV